MPHVSDLRYDQVCFKASHNSYECMEQPAWIHLDMNPGRPCDGRCRGLEFDLVQSSHAWEWCVAHGGRFDNGKPKLSAVLSELDAWTGANPKHDPLTIHLDLKRQPRDDAAFAVEFDRYIRSFFDVAKLFRPADLIGGQPDLMRGVRQNGWPTLGELEGKVLFCLSGRSTTKQRYAAVRPEERLCFADQEVGVREVMWRPPLDRGDRVFFNFFLTPSNLYWASELAWYAGEPGLITRAYVLNDRHMWARALQEGVGILSTDKVSNVHWASVGNGCFARRGG